MTGPVEGERVPPAGSAAGSDARGATPAGPAALRRHNLGLVLAVLRAEGGASRARLAARTGLTRATVASLVEPLLGAGVLAEDAAVARGVGRPSRAVRFHPEGPVAVGVAVDVDSLAACAVGLDGTVRARRRVARDHRDLSPGEVADGAAGAARQVLREAAPGPERHPDVTVLGVGLAAPALIVGAGGGDRGASGGSGTVLRAPNLPLLVGSHPGEDLGLRLGLPVSTGNEATLGALAHVDLAPDFAYVSGGVGIGGGVVLGGRVYRGVHGLAGELGHVVVERDGPACGCGGRGCVERYAGTEALLADADAAEVASLEAALAAGDPRAAAAVARAGGALGTGLASVLNVLDVPVVVLGGTLARLAPALLPSLRAELDRRGLAPSPPRLLASPHGADAAVLGAAGAVLAEAFADPARLGGPEARAG